MSAFWTSMSPLSHHVQVREMSHLLLWNSLQFAKKRVRLQRFSPMFTDHLIMLNQSRRASSGRFGEAMPRNQCGQWHRIRVNTSRRVAAITEVAPRQQTVISQQHGQRKATGEFTSHRAFHLASYCIYTNFYANSTLG